MAEPIEKLNIPPHEKDMLKRLKEVIDKVADYEKATSWEEFSGIKIARRIYKEYLRQTKAKYENVK